MDASAPLLIAYDGSNGAQAAIAAAAHLFPGSHAIVVTVWHSAAAAAPASLLAIPARVAAQAYGELDEETEQQASALAVAGATAAQDAGLDAVGITTRCHGQVWATIVETAEERDAQAVVLGSRGLSPVKSALLGSVASGVLHHCSRPVVVVPSRPSAR